MNANKNEMEKPDDIREKPQPTPDKNGNEVVVRLEHVKKSFGSKAVLKDINMQLRSGENLIVLGRSGTGKSVTIKCMVGMLTQDEGVCNVFGQEVKTLSDTELKYLRVKIGFLFQSGALYDSMTVRDNLAFPLSRVLKMTNDDEINQLVEEMLENVGLKDAIDKMPADLSGGMRKRIGLARTLIMKPQIMLYDEPTTGLDPITSREISKLILTMQKKYKTSSIIITHDMACAKITGDRILVMKDGEFIAEGSYNELEHSDNEFVSSFFK
jgi:phospholipid/cholesterol/gamma-HCH transport system ATP-binding protein